jgi:hypothetical protein
VALVERAMTPREGERHARGWAPHAVTADRAALEAVARHVAARDGADD